MSGAAAIAAAKNRRGRAETNQKQLPPPISCGKNNTCPPQNKSAQAVQNRSAPQTNKIVPQSSMPSDLVDPTSLQILGPLPPAQILRLHEQRLNKIDEKFITLCQNNVCGTNTTVYQPNVQPEVEAEAEAEAEDLSEEIFGRLGNLESKVTMLEEVIMTLQNKLTIAQNFAMETSLSVTNAAKENQRNIDKILEQVLEQVQAQVLEQVQAQVQAQVLEQVQAQVQAHIEAHTQLNNNSSIDVTSSTTPTTPTIVVELAALVAEPVVAEENISMVISETN
jgi:hypothetical protein